MYSYFGYKNIVTLFTEELASLALSQGLGEIAAFIQPRQFGSSPILVIFQLLLQFAFVPGNEIALLLLCVKCQ